MPASLFLSLLVCLVNLPGIDPDPDPGGVINTIYVVEFTHADVGFNAPPTVMQERNHDRTAAALDLADNHPEFHWTIETTYQLECFLERASALERMRLITLLAEGRFAVGGNYLNLHSGFCGEEQMHRLFELGAVLEPFLGYRPSTAMLNDVPGFSLALPRICAGSDIPYAVLGANDFIGGKPDIPLQDRPFWWEARDGSRVLTWLNYGSYIEGYFEWGLTSLTGMLINIPPLIDEFESAGYPYDAILVSRAADDTFPDATMVSLAEQWNLAGYSPRIEPATAREFFDYMLGRYGDVFPTYGGDASGFWEDVTTVTPASTARVRRTRSALPSLESLWSMLLVATGVPYPAEDFRTAWNLSMVFDEHSSGGYGWPGLLTEPEIRRENMEFVAIALGCESIADKLRQQAVNQAAPHLVPSGQSGLVLFNPLGETFEGIVDIDCGGQQPVDLRFADPGGGPDAEFRWLDADRTAVAVKVSVPAFGWRRWDVATGGNTPPPPSWQAGNTITAGDHRLTINAADGTAESLEELSTSFDWLAQTTPHLFAGIEFALHLEEFLGVWTPFNPAPSSVLAEDPTPLFRRIRVVLGHDLPMREYRLYEEERRVDVRIEEPTSLLPFVPYDDHSHHYGVSFPANLTTPTALHIDGPDGWYSPGQESLPGAALGHFAASTGARLVGSQGRWLSVTSRDTPIVNLGEMNGSGLPEVEDDEVCLTWKLRRHADLSQVSGGGLVPMEAEPGMPDITPYEFCIRFGGGSESPPDRGDLRNDLAPPFFAWIEQGQGSAALPAGQSLLEIQGPAEMICLKRSEAGDGLVLRLRAGAGGGDAVIIPMREPASAWITNLVERPIQPLSVVNGKVTVPLVAGGVVTVLLKD